VDDLTRGIDSLLAVAAVAVLAPFVSALLPGHRVPQIVVLILGGVLIGPQALGLAETATIELFSNVGLGFVFLLAGYELDPTMFRERSGRLGLAAWFVTFAIALVVTGGLEATGFVHAFAPVSLAFTTTALGILVPIMRDSGMLGAPGQPGGPFGRYVVAAGVTGELLPVVAIAVFLGTSNRLHALLSLAAVGALAAVFVLGPRLVRSRRLAAVMAAGEHASSQTTLRAAVVLLLALLAFAARFGLDIVLGAFVAGIVLRQWSPGDVRQLEAKLDAVGYGVFIPVFFVSAGMGLDVRSIVEEPLAVLGFLALLLVVRGLAVLVVYRTALTGTQRVQMGLLTATTLPLLVALTQVGLDNGTMHPEDAAAVVGAGVASVLIFPAVAVALWARSAQRRRRRSRVGWPGRRLTS
jgi:Kef-type K+ transport system membrane component KefB